MGCLLPWMEGGNPCLSHGDFSLREEDSRTAPGAGHSGDAQSWTIPGDRTEPWVERARLLPVLWPFRASQGQGTENPWSFSAATWLTHRPTLGFASVESDRDSKQDSGLLQHWASRGHFEEREALRRMGGGNKHTPYL